MKIVPRGHGRWLLLIPLLLATAGLLATPADPAPDAGADEDSVAARSSDPAADEGGWTRTVRTASGDTVFAVDTSAEPPVDAFSAAPLSGPRDTRVRLGRPLAWVDGAPIPYTPASIFVLPGERVHIDVASDPSHQRLVRLAGSGQGEGAEGVESGGDAPSGRPGSLRPLDDDTWVWRAPTEPGTHRLEVHSGTDTEVELRAFVMVPNAELSGGRLNGYRIGTYPRVPLRGDTMYVRPDGFIEVTEANREMRVSPRFRLKHFETKQGGGFPRYVVLQRKLLTKLELLVDALVKRGYPVRSLHVMSGYRTPSYNAGIGNVRYSRHVFGDAADVFVDEDGDGWMDDLNDDGRVTRADARVLYQVVDSLDDAIDTRRLLGGAGLYGPASHRGPFVHVDTRGHIARW